MTCEILTAIQGDFFSKDLIEQTALYVPEVSLNSYKMTYPWGAFGTINGKKTNTDELYKIHTDTKTAELAIYKGSATDIVIPESVTRDGVTYSVTSLGYNCFYDCESLSSVTIPSSVTSLGDWCFFCCWSLTSVTIPSSVTSLGDGCFALCCSLTSIDIPSSVTRLGRYCFGGCESLTSVTIPSSVTSLGTECFSECNSLESIKVDQNNTVYDSRENCNAIIETETNKMVAACKTTIIPKSVTGLGDWCFEGCSSLTSIDIPSSVTSLGDFCFYDCSSLTSIDIPSSVTSLGEYCFDGCSTSVFMKPKTTMNNEKHS